MSGGGRALLAGREPYRPGRTPRPPKEYLAPLIPAAPKVTDPQAWDANGAYLAGFTLLEDGYFWEAHEVWRPVRTRAARNSRERMLLLALIRTAEACLKTALERHEAAARLWWEAESLAAEVAASGPPLLMGVDTARLAGRIAAAGAGLELPASLFTGMPVDEYIARSAESPE